MEQMHETENIQLIISVHVWCMAWCEHGIGAVLIQYGHVYRGEKG